MNVIKLELNYLTLSVIILIFHRANFYLNLHHVLLHNITLLKFCFQSYYVIYNK